MCPGATAHDEALWELLVDRCGGEFSAVLTQLIGIDGRRCPYTRNSARCCFVSKSGSYALALAIDLGDMQC